MSHTKDKVIEELNKKIIKEENNCPLGGDTKNNCADCVYSGDYEYKNGECLRRKTEKDKFIQWIKDQQGEDYIEEQGYRKMELKDIIEVEKDHYKDFNQKK